MKAGHQVNYTIKILIFHPRIEFTKQRVYISECSSSYALSESFREVQSSPCDGNWTGCASKKMLCWRAVAES
jgi:hypothetical protein